MHTIIAYTPSSHTVFHSSENRYMLPISSKSVKTQLANLAHLFPTGQDNCKEKALEIIVRDLSTS